MSLEKHTVSLGLALKMRELGFPQNSLFYHVCITHPEGYDYPFKDESKRLFDHWRGDAIFIGELESHTDRDRYRVSAPLASELGEWLPRYNDLMNEDNNDVCICTVSIKFDKGHYNEVVFHQTKAENECNARAKMLIRLAENGYPDPKLLSSKDI